MPVRVNLKRLEGSIVNFERAPVVKGRILFYGDSFFTRWKPEPWGHPSLESVIVGESGTECTLNHGFGSSTAEELLYYYPRAVKPYEPRAIVYKTFGNDMLFGYSPSDVLEISARLFEYARTDFPGIRLYLFGPEGNRKPTTDYHIRKREYDSLLRHYASQHEDCTYISIMESPLFFYDRDDMGDFTKVREDIFVEDGVHFNRKGYELFAKFFKKELASILE